MAVISISTTDATPKVRRWEMPAGPQGIRSPVPRGILCFNGTTAIASKLSTNVTNVRLIVQPPTGYVHLLKSFALRVASDDLSIDFGLFGTGSYSLASTAINPHFNIVAPGISFVTLATRANIIFVPTPDTPKFFLVDTDNIAFNVQDMSADASTAGDYFWNVELYQFDVDQIDKFELNTPIPVISSTSF